MLVELCTHVRCLFKHPIKLQGGMEISKVVMRSASRRFGGILLQSTANHLSGLQASIYSVEIDQKTQQKTRLSSSGELLLGLSLFSEP